MSIATLRYVRAVVEHCSRTQCDAPATARVTFDAVEAFVWIDRFEARGPLDVGARGAGALCTLHADGLVAPRGWALQDRRDREPRLWSDRPASLPEPTPGVARLRPAAPTLREQPLPFAAAGAPAAAAEPASPPDIEPADIEPADIERMLDTPASPLLARAFNAARAGHAG